MAFFMAFAQAHVDELDALIATFDGVAEVSYNGRTVRYTSIDDLIKRRDFVAAQVGKATQAAAAGSSRCVSAVKPVVFVTRRGF